MSRLFSAFVRFNDREGQRMRALFEAIVPLWNHLHDSTGGDLVVGACDNVNKFFKIDLDTKVLFFLSPRDQSSDYLIKVCAGFTHCCSVIICTHVCTDCWLYIVIGVGRACQAPERVCE